MKTHAITAQQLLPNLEAYRKRRRFQDIEEAIRGFLNYRARDAEPYLYEMLAVAIEMNKGKPEDVKAALGYAASQALKTNRTIDLTRVADDLAIHGMPERAGPLLDRAAELDPADARPLWMSIHLAARTKDPTRMGAAVARLLALGWPGVDETWRAEARRQVETLAKTLREDGRDAEATALLERLKSAEPRDLVLILTWTGDADLDLAVTESLGAVARVATPRTVFGGAIVKNGYGKHPEEVYSCPLAFDGDYTVRVETIYNDEKTPVRQATLTILRHEGTDHEQKEVRTIALPKPAPVVVHVEGGRRKQVLPFQAPPVVATPTPQPTAPRSTPTPSSAADALKAPGAKPAPRR